MKKEDTKWFKNSNYEPLRNITLHHWFRQLYVRQVLYNYLHSGLGASHASLHFCAEHIKFNPEFSFDLAVRIWIEIIKTSPVIPD